MQHGGLRLLNASRHSLFSAAAASLSSRLIGPTPAPRQQQRRMSEGLAKKRKVTTKASQKEEQQQREGNGEGVPTAPYHTVGSTFKVPGLLVTNHHFRVPLDYAGHVDGEIDLFVRELASPTVGRRSTSYLLYLQGKQENLCAVCGGERGAWARALLSPPPPPPRVTHTRRSTNPKNKKKQKAAPALRRSARPRRAAGSRARSATFASS
jgi:hypothetical protein